MSKTADGTVHCDYIHCHLVIIPADRSQLNFLKSDYHGACFLAERRQKEEAQNPRAVFVTAFLLTLLVVISFNANADEPGDERGCYITYNASTGKFRFEPFLKIAHPKLSPSEDGEPEIWGFRPWNPEPIDENGKTPPVNILESRFIPLHTLSEVRAGTARRKLRCPDGLW